MAFDDLRMEDIAAASGIPRATLYYYFAGKDDVLAFLLRAVLADLRVSVSAAVETGRDTRTRLAILVRAHLEHLGANPGASQLLLANLGKAGKLPDIAAGIDAAFHQPVRKILRDGIERGDIVEIDAETVASALFGAVTVVGLRALVLEGGIDVDRTAHALFPLFWAGLAEPVTPAPRVTTRTRKR